MIRTLLGSFSAALLLSACSQSSTTDAPPSDEAASTAPQSNAAEASISTENLSDIVKVLASDEFEGRAPGTDGETKTVAYLIDKFEQIGLEPAGRNGGTSGAALLPEPQQRP